MRFQSEAGGLRFFRRAFRAPELATIDPDAVAAFIVERGPVTAAGICSYKKDLYPRHGCLDKGLADDVYCPHPGLFGSNGGLRASHYCRLLLHFTEKQRPLPGAGVSQNLFLAGCYCWWIADSRHGLAPTGLVKVQYSWNFTGSVLLPDTIAPVASSVV